jgi:hypothetical protein
LYIFVELLQKHPAAAKRKGVVGKIGSTIPMTPKTMQTKPTTIQNALVTLRPFFSHRTISEVFPLSIVQHPFLSR